MTTKANKSKDENKVIVELAGKDFVLRRIPMAKVKTISKIAVNVFRDFKDEELTEGNVFEQLVERFLEFPYEMLSLFVKGLPREIFLDEENGVTYPEFRNALKQAIELNELDTLQGFFSKMAPSIGQAMTIMQPKGK